MNSSHELIENCITDWLENWLFIAICFLHNAFDRQDDSDSEEEEEIEPAPFRRVLALNKTEWPYILWGSIAAAINGAIQPFFAILFSGLLYVSLTSKQFVGLLCFYFLIRCFLPFWIFIAGNQWLTSVQKSGIQSTVSKLVFLFFFKVFLLDFRSRDD